LHLCFRTGTGRASHARSPDRSPEPPHRGGERRRRQRQRRVRPTRGRRPSRGRAPHVLPGQRRPGRWRHRVRGACCGRRHGHVAAGATAKSTDMFFAEGYTGPGFTEYLTIAVSEPTRATFTYGFSDGRPAERRQVDLAPGRQTVLVNREVPAGDVSIRLQTTN